MANKSPIRLSVIIPGYNTPTVLWRRCLASVLAATGPNDEIIIVDDGSKEAVDLPSILPLQLPTTTPVKLLRRENGGLASARNSGIELAKGQFITFVDSDDEVSPGVYDACIDQLESTNSDVCLFGVKTIWVDEGIAKTDVPERTSFGALTPENILSLASKCLFNYACNKVYRRSVFEGGDAPLRFIPNTMPCEDTIFNLKVILRDARWCSVDFMGYLYYRTNTSLLSTYKPSNLTGEIAGSDMWKNYKQFVPHAREVLGNYGETSASTLDALEWRNIWQTRSPYSLIARWQWLRQHPDLGGAFFFVKTMAFIFVRRHLYVRALRRWNIKRLYPYAEPYEKGTQCA